MQNDKLACRRRRRARIHIMRTAAATTSSVATSPCSTSTARDDARQQPRALRRRDFTLDVVGLAAFALAGPRTARAAPIDSGDFYAKWPYSKPSDIIPFVEANATRGDPASVLKAYDLWREYYPQYSLGNEKTAKYAEVLRARDPMTVVEIGTFLGYSAISTGAGLREGGRMLCVEFEPRHADVARWALDFASLSDKVTVVTAAGSAAVGTVKDFVESVSGKGAGVDVLFLDHAKERYLPDLKLYEDANVVVRGTTVVADNVIYPGAPGWLEYVDSAAGRYDTRLIEAMFEYDQVWNENWESQKDALSVSVKL